MTTPPQGPWSSGQPGGQPGGPHGGQGGQGGWGQQPPAQGGGGWGQQPPPQQPGQPPQQGGGGWGQQPGRPQPGQPQGQPPQQGQPEQGQPAQGWGRTPQGGQEPPPYQQQAWGQQGAQQGGWHQQQGGQQPWQQGPGGSKGGSGKDKLPLVIGGGVGAILVLGLVIFLIVRGLGGDDTKTADPDPTQPTSGSTTGSEPGKSSGQAEAATQKLQGIGYQCSDLFNNDSGGHRGCFKYEGATEADAVFQFTKDGSIIAVSLQSEDDENVNNAAVNFDAALQALGNDTFGGSEVKKIQDAVKTGQKSDRVGTTWGEFRLSNNGSLRLSGRKSGEDEMKLPEKTWQTTEAQLKAALAAKGYDCKIICGKKIGDFGTQRIYGFGSSSGGLRQVELSLSGREADVKAAWPGLVGDAFGILKGEDSAALKEFIDKHNDGKAAVAYVAGWRVEVSNNDREDYLSRRFTIKYEYF